PRPPAAFAVPFAPPRGAGGRFQESRARESRDQLSLPQHFCCNRSSPFLHSETVWRLNSRSPPALPPSSVRSEVSDMLVIPGYANKDTCDGVTRRDLLRIGGSAMMGLSLANILGLQKAAGNTG